MGEATYYIKARFGKEFKGQDEVKKFFIEGARAGDFWQSNRSADQSTFWKLFTTKFPLVTEYLNCYKPYIVGGDNNNTLAGLLDFGEEEEIGYSLKFDDDNIMSYCAFVWHCADWDPIGTFLVEKFGAIGVDWLSDEDINPFHLLKV